MNKLDLFFITLLPLIGISTFGIFIRVTMKKPVKKWFILLGVFICFGILVFIPFKKRIIQRIQLVNTRYFNYTHPSNRTVLGGIKLDKDDYKRVHRPMAIKVTNNGFIKTNRDLRNKINNGQLVAVEEGEGFYLLNGPNSSTHLTPFAKKRLLELGRLFRSFISKEENKKDYFVLSSLTRTEVQQQTIREKYPRQATKGTSTHSYGVSFDISEMKSFADSRISLKALEDALKKMQSEKKILLCPESTCIHVTVIK